MEIANICILGAGNLGSRIGLQAALSGFIVTVYDINPKSLDSSLITMNKVIRYLIKSQEITENEGVEAIQRITFTPNPIVAVANADLISESVTEDLEIKKSVWKQFGEIAPTKTIFTTNTSYLLPSMLAEDSGRPKQFCAFHFHDVFHSRVVDIMPHPNTDPELIAVLEDLGRKLKQIPILVKKEHSGYIFNTLLVSLIDAAGRLVTGEVAEIEAIDKSWMINFNMPIGPFGILDNVGIDTAWRITSVKRNAASRAFADFLKTYVDQGKLGEKTGEGFYKYPHPSYKNRDFLK